MAKKSAAKAAPAKQPAQATTLVVRSRTLLKSAPGTLGFSHLLVPDEAFGNSKFKANLHFAGKAAGATFERINEAYWELIPELLDQATEKKVKDKVKILSRADVLAHLQEKLKTPGENSKVSDPYFIFDCNSHFTNKEKEQQAITIKAWDPHGAPVDLKEMRLGMGSTVQALFSVGVWAGNSPFSKWVALPTIRLVGLQVLKLKQYGGGGQQAVAQVSADDLAFLEDNFSADELDQYALKGKPKAPAEEAGMEDEIPF